MTLNTRSLLTKLFISTFAAFVVLATLEVITRAAESKDKGLRNQSVDLMMKSLPNSFISGREIGNIMIAHSVALYASHPNPSAVTDLIVGTSRSKVIRPSLEGTLNMVNASGNSYNEITYGLLMQAEAARLNFPNLKRVYFEGSLLLRRPARAIVEKDHDKYLPLLKSLLVLGQPLEQASKIATQLEDLGSDKPLKVWPLHSVNYRGQWRIAKLLGLDGPSSITVLTDPALEQLNANGEQIALLGNPIAAEKITAAISAEHIKVQRLRDVTSWVPWDGLYDLIALWGKKHSLEIVLFQPPVRSDLYAFELKHGLNAHNADLERISNLYKISYVNLNLPELGYMDKWSLFSDEDHVGSCLGVRVFQRAIFDGALLSKKTGELSPMINSADIEQAVRTLPCSASDGSK
jgi:hypothetical protein